MNGVDTSVHADDDDDDYKNDDNATYCFAVDASEAGAGNLEVAVRSTKTGLRIPHFLEADDRSTGLFQIRFRPPAGCCHYQIDVAFNDWPVNGESGSPYTDDLLRYQLVVEDFFLHSILPFVTVSRTLTFWKVLPVTEETFCWMPVSK